MSENTALLTEEPINDTVKELVEKWENVEGNLIMIFHGIQKHYGYVPRNVAKYVSEAINVPLTRIYELPIITSLWNRPQIIIYPFVWERHAI